MTDKLQKKGGALTAEQSAPEPGNVSLLTIPEMLFEEVREVLGTGELFNIANRGDRWRCIALRPDHRYTGFAGAIGWRGEDGAFGTLVLWPRVPRPETVDSVAGPLPVLKIHACAKMSGVWAYGRGEHLQETITADFDYYGTAVTSPAMRLIAPLLLRAHQLASDPRVVAMSFWEADRPLE